MAFNKKIDSNNQEKNIEKENGKLFSHEIYLTSLDKQGVCPTITTGTPTGSYHLELLD